MRQPWIVAIAATLVATLGPAGSVSAKAWTRCKTVPGRTVATNAVWRIVSTPLTTSVGDPVRGGYLIACRHHDGNHRRMRVLGTTGDEMQGSSDDTLLQLVGNRALVKTNETSVAGAISWDRLIDLKTGADIRVGVDGQSTDAIITFQAFLGPDGALATLSRGLARAPGAASAATSGPVPPAAVLVWDATGKHVGPLATSIGAWAQGPTPGFSYIAADGSTGAIAAAGVATGLGLKRDPQLSYSAIASFDCPNC